MAGLAANNLTCIKRDRVLFTELSFTLVPGQLIYLRGPNGAGKTSLLRILTGLSAPESGDLTLNDEPLERVRDRFNQQLIYIGHKAGVNGVLTAMENLRFWCAQHGAPFLANEAYRVLELLGLVGLEDVPVRLLSAGQQRRVALSRLWLKKATYWILDEPFTALDTDGIELLEMQMCQHVAGGGAIITTSHQPLSRKAGAVDELLLEYRL